MKWERSDITLASQSMGNYEIHNSDSRIREPLWPILFNYFKIHMTMLFLSRQKKIIDFDNVFPKEILKWGLILDKTWTTESILPAKSFLLLLSKCVLIICVTEMFYCHKTVYFQYKYHKGNIKVLVLFLTFGICSQRTGILAFPASGGYFMLTCFVSFISSYLWTGEN